MGIHPLDPRQHHENELSNVVIRKVESGSKVNVDQTITITKSEMNKFEAW